MPETNPMLHSTAAANSAPVAPSSADPTTAGNIASSKSEKPTSMTKIGSLGELRKKAPEVYHQMEIGIAMNICRESADHQRRLKEMMRESRQNA